MERLIDSDKFLQEMADLYRQAGWDEREVHFSLADLRSNIGMEDTILIPQREPDTVPVRHGKWIWRVEYEDGTKFAGYRCSVCDYWQSMGAWNYCPNCGAEMDCEGGSL